jgi:hypothetical protein
MDMDNGIERRQWEESLPKELVEFASKHAYTYDQKGKRYLHIQHNNKLRDRGSSSSILQRQKPEQNPTRSKQSKQSIVKESRLGRASDGISANGATFRHMLPALLILFSLLSSPYTSSSLCAHLHFHLFSLRSLVLHSQSNHLFSLPLPALSMPPSLSSTMTQKSFIAGEGWCHCRCCR